MKYINLLNSQMVAVENKSDEVFKYMVKPLESLHCSCCGYPASGRNWKGGEHGFGICSKCTKDWKPSDLVGLHGYEGIHYNPVELTINSVFFSGTEWFLVNGWDAESDRVFGPISFKKVGSDFIKITGEKLDGVELGFAQAALYRLDEEMKRSVA